MNVVRFSPEGTCINKHWQQGRSEGGGGAGGCCTSPMLPSSAQDELRSVNFEVGSL